MRCALRRLWSYQKTCLVCACMPWRLGSTGKVGPAVFIGGEGGGGGPFPSGVWSCCLLFKPWLCWVVLLCVEVLYLTLPSICTLV